MNTARHLFDLWVFYLTNETGTSMAMTNFVALGTGMVGFGVAALIVWPFLPARPPKCFCRPKDAKHTCMPECYEQHLRHSHWEATGHERHRL